MSQCLKSHTFFDLCKSVKNKFLFTMTAYTSQTRTTLCQLCATIRWLPITALDLNQGVCCDALSTKMQCLRPLRHSGGPEQNEKGIFINSAKHNKWIQNLNVIQPFWEQGFRVTRRIYHLMKIAMAKSTTKKNRAFWWNYDIVVFNPTSATKSAGLATRWTKDRFSVSLARNDSITSKDQRCLLICH